MNDTLLSKLLQLLPSLQETKGLSNFVSIAFMWLQYLKKRLNCTVNCKPSVKRETEHLPKAAGLKREQLLLFPCEFNWNMGAFQMGPVYSVL